MRRINLRHLILSLTLVAVLVTLANALYASNRVQRGLLLDTTLDANYAYAKKLAQATDAFLVEAMAQLSYSADVLMARELAAAPAFGYQLPVNTRRLNQEVTRLQKQGNLFDSAHIAAADGTILAHAAPSSPVTTADDLIDPAIVQQALDARSPFISRLYRTSRDMNNRLLLAWPLFESNGVYAGYVGGVVHTEKNNVLRDLLGQQFYHQDAVLYVLDSTGTVIYHTDREHVGANLAHSPVGRALQAGGGGGSLTQRDNDEDMLTGYALVHGVNWGIVAQRPASSVLMNAGTLLRQTLIYTLPVMLALIALIWWVSRRITLPLSQLARRSRHMNNIERTRSQLLPIRTWYLEVAQLKQSLLHSLALINNKLRQLRKESSTDQLTGLANRRGLDEQVTHWITDREPFALLLLDVDNFKQINDSYGHDIGDQVLQRIADVIRDNSRGPDLPCRTGGEEFALFLPGTSASIAYRVAERLRLRMENTVFPLQIRITISIGIALYPDNGATLSKVTKTADLALYAAKRNGRNRIEPPPVDLA